MAGVQVITETVRGEVLFNDTEGADFRDQNDMQRIIRRALAEEFLQGTFGYDTSGSLPLRTFGQGLLPMEGGGSNMNIKIGKGPCVHLLTDPGDGGTGTAIYGAVLFHKRTVTTITVDTADPTNPRWDIISAKLEILSGGSQTRKFRTNPTTNPSSQSFNKERQYKLTLTYTPGTPAGSPAEPSVPSGEVKIARIEVAALQTNLDYPVDFRVPAGTRRWCPPMTLGFGSGWTAAGASDDGQAVAASGLAVFRIPIQPPTPFSAKDGDSMNMRLRSMSVGYKLGASATVVLARRSSIGTTITWTTIETLTSLFTRDGVQRVVTIPESSLAYPLWAGGANHAHDAGVDNLLCLAVLSNASGDNVRGVSLEWYGSV